MIRTLVLTGGNVNLNFLKEYLMNNRFDTIIASDKGLEALDKCGLIPNYIIGDFDSVNVEILNRYKKMENVKIIKLNPIKDYTDTHMALKLAIDLKSMDITVIGAIGTRIDHTISNINVLKEALDNNVKCEIINENNKVFLINKSTRIKNEKQYPFISLIPLTTVVDGITLTGFKYNLKNATMSIGESIGISNEQIEENAEIKLKNGILIVIKSKD